MYLHAMKNSGNNYVYMNMESNAWIYISGAITFNLKVTFQSFLTYQF